MTGRLAHEPSLYLRQHATNPVEWYPWGEEAFAVARAEGRPVFLSIGYSACHWCHVMAHESFENAEIASYLNSHFVCVKVDRQERPDLDSIYMAAVQALTGSGGWPMSLFLTPEGYPFYAGTYFPPEPRHGLPAFRQILHGVAEAWRTRRQDLESGSRRLAAAIVSQQDALSGHADEQALRPDTLYRAFDVLRDSFDRDHGGWGGPQKFPQPMILEFLLRFHCLTQDATALQMVTQTLDMMAMGALFDQLGGGFHRYCVDREWTVPHFEKMLYDNAQLARVYLHAWQITCQDRYRSITEETLDYVIREMADSRGGFLSAQDADSEGEEGRFFLWSLGEIGELLGSETERFASAYGVTLPGNFEGRSTLRFREDPATRPTFAASRRRLLEARELRAHPARDDQVLTSWNGLMLAALAEAARALSRTDYGSVAARCARFLLTEAWSGGRLSHTWRGGHAGGKGFLEDYACLLEGLIELYQLTFDPYLLTAAREMAQAATSLFGDAGEGFYDTSHDDKTPIVRPRDLQDGSTPSGSSMAVSALLRLGDLVSDMSFVATAVRTLLPLQPALARHPLAFGQWLQALCYAVARTRQVAIVGNPELDETKALLAAARSGYRPFQVVLLDVPSASAVPLFEGRTLIDGKATAYVCSGGTCRPPTSEASTLVSMLGTREDSPYAGRLADYEERGPAHG